MPCNTHLTSGMKGGLKVNEHQERLRELYRQALKDYTPAILMKLVDEKLL
jgi:hypothetical protein